MLPLGGTGHFPEHRHLTPFPHEESHLGSSCHSGEGLGLLEVLWCIPQPCAVSLRLKVCSVALGACVYVKNLFLYLWCSQSGIDVLRHCNGMI